MVLGREADLTVAAERLQQGARVLTVTGVGGTGKTRLAVALFHRLHSEYAGGAAFVSLASVTSAADVMPTISATLGIAEAHGRSALDALATVIGAQPVLLVLDILEQVVDAARDMANLVSKCAGLRVIATSRQPLKIGAESELALAPLGLPDAGTIAADELMHYPAVALFVQRAEKVKPGFTLSAANAVSVAAICCSLDGLPLALELAAARVRILEPAVLLHRLDHALDLLSSGDRDLPLRQRTLRATISWSSSLLDESEKQLLRRLSAFHDGWTLDAMEQVCFSPDDRWSAVDGLESLVEKGLVRVAHAAILWCTSRARTGDAESLERGMALCGNLNWFWHIAGHHLTARGMVDTLVAMAQDNAPSLARAGAMFANGMTSTVTGEWDRSLMETTTGYRCGGPPNGAWHGGKNRIVAGGDTEAAAGCTCRVGQYTYTGSGAGNGVGAICLTLGVLGWAQGYPDVTRDGRRVK